MTCASMPLCHVQLDATTPARIVHYPLYYSMDPVMMTGLL